MKIAFFDTHRFERGIFRAANFRHRHELTFLEPRLSSETAPLARGYPCVCCFVNDVVNAPVLQDLAANGLKLVALRATGHNNVDLPAAAEAGVTVVRVPAYSPHAVAEYAVGMLLSLVRSIHKAHLRVHQLNFSIEGFVGFDLAGKTIGVIGTGKIGAIFATIMKSMGCSIVAHDPFPNPELENNGTVRYVPLETLYRESDVVSLHAPLTPESYHLLNSRVFSLMKRGVVIINTGRGALIDSVALIDALKTERIGGAALDVYEEEEGIFFENISEKAMRDDVLSRLIMFPNVLITSHQAFLTREALTNIADTTLRNIAVFEQGGPAINTVSAETRTRGKAA